MNEVATHELNTKLRSSVASTVDRLQQGVLGKGSPVSQSEARRILAILRQHGNTPIDKDPLSMERSLSILTFPLADFEYGKGDLPSPSECAAHLALSLFAVHMQSAHKPMHLEGRSFAAACGMLVARSDSESLKPRFDAMVLASDPTARIIHMRSLITLLRSQELGFDYGSLAVDLRSLAKPDRKNHVLMRWGRDFARAARPAPAKY
mgnify:FL=1